MNNHLINKMICAVFLLDARTIDCVDADVTMMADDRFHVTVDAIVFQLVHIRCHANEQGIHPAFCVVEAVQTDSHTHVLNTAYSDHTWTLESVTASVQNARVAWDQLQLELGHRLTWAIEVLREVSMLTSIKAVEYGMVQWSVPPARTTDCLGMHLKYS